MPSTSTPARVLRTENDLQLPQSQSGVREPTFELSTTVCGISPSSGPGKVVSSEHERRGALQKRKRIHSSPYRVTVLVGEHRTKNKSFHNPNSFQNERSPTSVACNWVTPGDHGHTSPIHLHDQSVRRYLLSVPLRPMWCTSTEATMLHSVQLYSITESTRPSVPIPTS
ncbi:hypothetical protein QBC45DRAFT_430660 [Copromyces sp. CBS 386.78]|nr:hypothetical protein QBC45DRAFT_430660 [Copromyces sp. CBS 386.78]